jgi:hypothetical protein
MRTFSYLFHSLLALFLLAVAVVAWFSEPSTLKIGILPFAGSSLIYWLVGSGLVGIATVYLAAKRILPVVFLLWSLVVFGMLVYGYFLTRYSFDSGGMSTALFLVVGSAIAALAAWRDLPRRPPAAS